MAKSFMGEIINRNSMGYYWCFCEEAKLGKLMADSLDGLKDMVRAAKKDPCYIVEVRA